MERIKTGFYYIEKMLRRAGGGFDFEGYSIGEGSARFRKACAHVLYVHYPPDICLLL